MEKIDIDKLVDIISQEFTTYLNEKNNTSSYATRNEKLQSEDIKIDVSYDDFNNLVKIGVDRITTKIGSKIDQLEIAKYIDHTLLKPESTTKQIRQLCQEALEYKFASVCVNPGHVKLCSELLAGSSVNVCTVIGFPLGATTTLVKTFEAENAIKDGASELDMVMNIGALKERDLTRVGKDIEAIVQTAHRHNALLKVIIETSLLSYEEKILACLISKAAGADFVKTSTGFSSGGATVEDIHLMVRAVGQSVGVKASGGVRSLSTLLSMVEAGSTRIGATVGVKVMHEISENKPAYESINIDAGY